MKRISSLVFIGLMVFATSCKKYLDVNHDPNTANIESATPELILPQALVGTANNLNQFNSYGAQLVGYMANAGGYGGFGPSISYNFTSANFSGLWSTTYDILEDYQMILNLTDGDTSYSYFNAAARIMKAHSFQLLVDAYNDVPYVEALKGPDNLTPAYTDATDIYKDLVDQLDAAIEQIRVGQAALGTVDLGASDVLFKGNLTKWIQFANTIKLRILLHGNGKVSFSNTNFSSEGFLTEDALINPGYTRDNGRQNPKWNTWGWTYTGSTGAKSWMPSTFIMAFYDGTKLRDGGRGSAIYYQFPSTPTNRLGYEGNDVKKSPEGSFWYPGVGNPGVGRVGSIAGDTTGVLKGPDAGMPVITEAESYFLQSEAAVRGILPGDAKELFQKGIVASFKYIYRLPKTTAGVVVYSGDPEADAQAYMDENSTSPLVNFDLATSTDQQIEAIITQKYIALNMVNSDEAWNEYRRTHYPTIVNSPGATATQTFASSVSESTAPDHLPTRIMYPSSEGSYNTANVPKGISVFTSKIFWAL